MVHSGNYFKNIICDFEVNYFLLYLHATVYKKTIVNKIKS